MGKWFEIKSYQFYGEDQSPEDRVGPCGRTNISRTDNETVTYTDSVSYNYEYKIINQSGSGAGKFELFMYDVDGNDTMPLWIIDTDYTNYSVWSTCKKYYERSIFGKYNLT